MGCGIIVTFDYGVWIARYPQFAALSPSLVQSYFDEATLYWSNDGSSPASTPAIQSMLLNMVTAHIATLNSQSQGDPTPGEAKDSNTPVGRIASVTQGSITVSTEMNMPDAPGSQAWFAQTQAGSSFWAATAQYRTMRYFRGRGASAYGSSSPYGPGLGRRGFWGR